MRLKEIEWTRNEKNHLIGKFKGADGPYVEIYEHNGTYWWNYFEFGPQLYPDEQGIASSEERAKESFIEVLKDMINNQISFILRVCEDIPEGVNIK